MNVVITRGVSGGKIAAIPAKADAHRAFIASALSGYEVYVGNTKLEFSGGRVVSGDYAGWGFDLNGGDLKFKHLA